ncbi:MAG: hypothetical protein AB7T37_15795 [Dehalococcoidia bacterium]
MVAALLIACGGDSEPGRSETTLRPSLEELAGRHVQGLERVLAEVEDGRMTALHFGPPMADGAVLSVTVEIQSCSAEGCDVASDSAAALSRATRDLTIVAANDPFLRMEAGRVALSREHTGAFVTIRSHVDVKLADGRTLVSTYNCYEATYNDGSWAIHVAVCPRGGTQVGSRSELTGRLTAAAGEATARQAFSTYASAFAGNAK